MIIHRDYRSSSDSIVKIFNDRIEFYNPGKLPEGITVNDLLTNNYKSTPRNKLVADFCKSLGLIEKYGSCIQRIIEHFEEANLPQPQFRNISEGFMVTIFSEEFTNKVPDKVPDNLIDNQCRILELVSVNNTISMS
jgi:ATP-dependent DNA helicase RecG